MKKNYMPHYRSLLILILLAPALAATGSLLYKHQVEKIEREKKEELSSITNFKILHLKEWFKEKNESVNNILNDEPSLKILYELTAGSPGASKDKDLFDPDISIFKFEKFLLLNRNFELVYSAITDSDFYSRKLIETAGKQPRKEKKIFSGIFNENKDSIKIALFFPVKYKEDHFGWMVNIIDPELELKPFIELSPVNLKTLSTLLIFNKDLALFYPSENKTDQYNLSELFTAEVHIENGLFEGKDAGNDEAIVYTGKIPGTSFYLMSKINKNEIFEIAGSYLNGIVLVSLLLFLISGLLIFVNWRNNKLKFYKKEYELEKEKNTLLKHYNYLSKYANDIIILLDENGIMLQANDKTYEVYGYTPEELLGKPGNLLRSDDEKHKFDGILKKLRQHKGIVYETIHVKKNGDKFFAEISVCPFTLEETTYIQAIIRDVTDRKKTEENIKQHAMFLDSVGQVVIAINNNLGIIYWNRAAEKLFGWKKQEVLGVNVLNLIPVDLSEDKIKGIITELKNGIGWSGEVQLKKKDGITFPAKVNSSPIYNSYDEVVGVVGVLDDLTDQKIKEEELLQAKEKAEEVNKLKSNFLANISHEVRTPLIGILGFSEMILDENYDPELKEKVGEIYKSGKKLNETLDTILDISKIEAEKINVTYEEFNLGETILESVALYKILAEEKGIYLQYSAGTNGLMVELDRKILSKIINNLLSNAVKYTSEGEILVSTHYENKKVSIEIEDTGVGIPEDKFDIIFEPFRQASEGYNRRYGGTGLGLTVTKILVEMMNGCIKLVSQYGKGTRVKVEFPVYSGKISNRLNNSEVNIEMKKEVPKFEKINLLLVEDDDVNAKIILRFLKEEYNTEWVVSGNEAVSLSEVKKFDGILMDISLKGEMDGLNTANRIRKIPGYEKSPVIAVTAHAMVGDKEKFLSGGCTHYISKPFSRNELLLLLKNIFS